MLHAGLNSLFSTWSLVAWDRITWPTGSFEAVSNGSWPSDAVDQRAVHVTPEVVGPIVALLVHEPETTADHLRRRKRQDNIHANNTNKLDKQKR